MPAPGPLCRYRIVSSTPAAMAVEMPPFRAEMPEKRSELPPACSTAQRIMSLDCWREQGRFVATVDPPLTRFVSGKRGGHTVQRAAGLARLQQAGETAIPATRIHTRNWRTMSVSPPREWPSAG